jgi:hypothetical protein
VEGGVDDLMAKHVAHLFIRQEIIIKGGGCVASNLAKMYRYLSLQVELQLG